MVNRSTRHKQAVNALERVGYVVSGTNATFNITVFPDQGELGDRRTYAASAFRIFALVDATFDNIATRRERAMVALAATDLDLDQLARRDEQLAAMNAPDLVATVSWFNDLRKVADEEAMKLGREFMTIGNGTTVTELKARVNAVDAARKAFDAMSDAVQENEKVVSRARAIAEGAEVEEGKAGELLFDQAAELFA